MASVGLSFATAVASPVLDACGGDYRIIAACSAAVWLALKAGLGDRGGVDWYSLAHAAVAGSGGCLCAFLDAHAASIDPSLGLAEPLRSVRCAGALTPLHSLLPMVTLGYAAADLLDGIRLGRRDFILHGLGLGLCFWLVCALGVPHLVACALVMDVSSVPLNFLRAATRWSPGADAAAHGAFALAFFACRGVAFPYFWGSWIRAYYDDAIAAAITGSSGALPSPCYPPSFIYAVIGFGLLFHGLNAYWMLLIAKKAARKLGQDKARGRGKGTQPRQGQQEGTKSD